jgi:hypothetical protein
MNQDTDDMLFLVLWYFDVTIIFPKQHIEKALDMELILCIFEQFSGLEFNFLKSQDFLFLFW